MRMKYASKLAVETKDMIRCCLIRATKHVEGAVIDEYRAMVK
jgi:hypothetical protein